MKNDHAASEYTFGLISDVHIDLEGGGERAYFRMAQKNFADALRFFRARGTDFIVSVGDQITAAEAHQPEWEAYRRIIRASGYRQPIFAAFGNHEARPAVTRGVPIEELYDAFLAATRADRGFGAARGGLYYSFDEPVFGDRFIFVALQGGMMVPFVDEFSAAQLDWLEDLLAGARREQRRVFLIQHASVDGCGVGDDALCPAYDGSMHIGDDFPHNSRFVDLIRQYRNLVWISGHTHVDLRDGVNYQGGDATCHMLHVPALCGTTRLVPDGGARRLDRTFHPDTAQAYLVRVTVDRAVFTGVNCNTGEPVDGIEALVITRR